MVALWLGHEVIRSMPDFVALKLLTEKSDLGWFESIYKRRALPGNQKGITIGSEVLKRFYPAIRARDEAYAAVDDRQKAAKNAVPPNREGAKRARLEKREIGSIPIVVTVYGPGLAAPITEERLITRQAKNWRLNGNFIHDPDGEPSRFDPTLQEGDIAVIGFDGLTEPTSVSVLLLAGAVASDQDLHARFASLLEKRIRSTVEISRADLLTAADALALPDSHPLRLFAIDSSERREIEQAASGDVDAGARAAGRKGRDLSPEELAAGKLAAERNGALGEKLVDRWLTDSPQAGTVSHVWKSRIVANSPYDFEFNDSAGSACEVWDVKTTSSAFGADFFMSLAEVRFASESPIPYKIARVYDVGDAGGWVKVSADIRPFAADLMSRIEAFPPGCKPSTIAIAPGAPGISWEAESTKLTATEVGELGATDDDQDDEDESTSGDEDE